MFTRVNKQIKQGKNQTETSQFRFLSVSYVTATMLRVHTSSWSLTDRRLKLFLHLSIFIHERNEINMLIRLKHIRNYSGVV